MSKHLYALNFRGEPVRVSGSAFRTTFTTVHPEVYVVLTYVRTNGVISRSPRVSDWYKTERSAVKRIKDDPTHLQQWLGQSFVVRVTPGTSEVTDLTVIPVKAS